MTIILSLPVEFGNWLAHFLSLDEGVIVKPKSIVDNYLQLEVTTNDVKLTIVKCALYLQIYQLLKNPNSLITIYHVRHYSSPRS